MLPFRRSAVFALALAALVTGVPAAVAQPALAAAPPPATAAPKLAATAAATAIDLRVVGDLVRTRLVIDLSASVDMRVFTLADPYRVVIDVPALEFRLPADAGNFGRGLVSAVRYGWIGPGKARIVLQVREPVAVDKSFVLDPLEGQPARLVVDLVRTDRVKFLRGAESAAQSRLEPPQAPVKPASTKLPVVVIDPGHGGVDSGAVSPGTGVAEKSVVLTVGQMLRERLESGGKVRVVMTRTDDVFVPLGERVRIARRNEAVLLISIHADAIRARDGSASGASVYTLSERASDSEAEHLAESENRADLIAGIDLREEPDEIADILIDLAQRETKTFSTHFAHSLVGELRGTARMHRTPLKSAGFKVLKAPDVPSVLLELGFISNPEELRQFTSEAWRRKVTGAVAGAIEQFVATRTAGTGRP